MKTQITITLLATILFSPFSILAQAYDHWGTPIPQWEIVNGKKELLEGKCPNISAQGDSLLLIRDHQLFIYKKTKPNTWTKAIQLKTSQEVQNVFWSHDGHIILFSAQTQNNNSDIFEIEKNNDEWSTAYPLRAPLNSSEYESSPTLSADGKTLFFCRTTNQDLENCFEVYSARQTNGKWGNIRKLNIPAVSFGKGIKLCEPYLTTDPSLKRLYFSEFPSDIELGDNVSIGIFNCDLSNTGKWNKPKLIMDLHSEENSTFLSMTQNRIHAVFSRNEDIWVPDQPMPWFVYAVDNYGPLLKEKGVDTAHEMHILGDITFKSSSYLLEKEIFPILDRISEAAKRQELTELIIRAHTDDVGTAEKNLALSEKRGIAVKNYLVKNGIASDLIKVNPFGETNPLFPNDSEEYRSKNRRIEIEFIK
ncbi:OmpA family protein [Sediminitomix flava]|uniref:WD40 repeat protein n=1 Tax=Sediminitomix flava TaxID=379075 RepID=A0A315ZC61_SEDFL|nr:OmpA family protein [Sediminitomix flava]PWJ42398.1 WD40 repeat protein [Sediminitomix flava]